MIKKEKTDSVQQIINVYYCDICGNKVEKFYQFGDTVCPLCKRDMCKKHRVVYSDPECDQTGDYTTMICTECSIMIGPYIEKLKNIQNEYDKKRDIILEEINTICEKNKTKKSLYVEDMSET